MKRKNRIERELDQKELESDIGKKLKEEEREREQQEKINREYNPVVLAAIRFLGNIAIGYMVFAFFKWFLGNMLVIASPEIAKAVYSIIHVLIWGMAVIGTVTKTSPWERFFT